MAIENENLTIGDFKHEHVIQLGLRQQAQHLECDCTLVLPMVSGIFGIFRNPKADFSLQIKLADPDREGFCGGVKLKDAHKFLTFGSEVTIEDGDPSKGHLHVNSTESSFKILLDPTQILDCRENQENLIPDADNNYLYKIPYTIILTEEYVDDPQSVEKQCEATLLVAAVRPDLEVDMELSTPTLTYSPQQEELIQIGWLKLWHKSMSCCSPGISLGVNLNLKKGNEPFQGAVATLKDRDANNIRLLRETHPLPPLNSISLDPNDSRFSPCQTIGYAHAYQGLYSNPGEDGQPNVVRIPLFWNMAAATNPISDFDVYKIEAEVSACYKIKGQVVPVSLGLRKVSVEFRLEKNKCLTGLDVFISENRADGTQGYTPLKSGQSFRVTEPLKANQLTYPFEIRLRNKAQAEDPDHPSASVVIANFNIGAAERVVLNEDGSVQLNERQQETRQPLDQILIDQEHLTLRGLAPDDITALPYDPDQEGLCAAFDINGQTLKRILGKTRSMLIHLPFSFDYIIDEEGGCMPQLDGTGAERRLQLKEQWNSRFNKFQGVLRLPVSLPVSPYWLSVDFGTSALVAVAGTADNTRLLDLKQVKERLIMECYPVKEVDGEDLAEPFRVDNSETSGQGIISSYAAFNPQAIDGEAYSCDPTNNNYKQMPLWFSPSSGMVIAQYLLPCLKQIVAFRNLPRIFLRSENAGFKYRDENGNVITGWTDNDEQPTPLGQMPTVFKVVYNQMLRLFINTALHDSSVINALRLGRNPQFNKLVLTVPNTYTPLHTAMLRNLALGIFPNLWKEHLRFVSESDAVACYYILNRRTFFSNMPNADLADADEERVLVYDMGAGTLDLTYFVRTRNIQGTTLIDVQGKMGVSKAGDYLDYVIAEIIVEKLNRDSATHTLFASLIDLKKTQSNVNLSANRKRFKDYVKTVVKPLLDDDTNPILPSFEIDNHTYDLSEITVGDIKKHTLFQDFIRDCTSDVLENFTRLYGKDGQLAADVVIFSGRSTALNSIRNGVVNYFGGDTLYADILETKMHTAEEITTLTTTPNKDLLKTVVAKGAIAAVTMFASRNSIYCLKNKSLYATYGAIAYYPEETIWIPLIKAGTSPTRMVETAGGLVGVFDVSTNQPNRSVNFDNVIKVVFVQSYSIDPQADISSNRLEKITELATFINPNDETYTGYLALSLRINEKGEFRFGIGAGELPTQPHNDLNNESFRKSLWPVIFVDQEE